MMDEKLTTEEEEREIMDSPENQKNPALFQRRLRTAARGALTPN
jgi:hypothetical protein